MPQRKGRDGTKDARKEKGKCYIEIKLGKTGLEGPKEKRQSFHLRKERKRIGEKGVSERPF